MTKTTCIEEVGWALVHEVDFNFEDCCAEKKEETVNPPTGSLSPTGHSVAQRKRGWPQTSAEYRMKQEDSVRELIKGNFTMASSINSSTQVASNTLCFLLFIIAETARA